MSRYDLRDLRWILRSVIVDEVVATGEAVIVSDGTADVAVIVSLSDYQRLRSLQ